ncbi:methyltransferase domain-containing protein [bacterium]|nr:methyltransferase domain-containing protein [bacterium]
MSTASLQTTDAREKLRDFLREYYGRRVKTSSDISQGACCTEDTKKRWGKVLELLPEEVVSRHYGCGCPIPEDDLTGLTCLDLGSGAGVDAFVLAHRVGPTGFVHGIDMTAQQLEIARRNAPLVLQRFGHARPNVAFHEGFIETADMIDDASIDLVISDCVLNLSPAKDEVYRTIWRVLREGGELYVTDISADRRVPRSIAEDEELIAECLGGAQYEHDWFDSLKDAGFLDPRVVSRRVVRRDVRGEPIVFSSLVVRAQKLESPLDRRCEDYGQVAVYKGNLASSPARFVYDDHHEFEAGRPVPVCRNTARMLSETRLRRYFEVTAPIRHFGLFPCGPSPAAPGARSHEPCC